MMIILTCLCIGALFFVGYLLFDYCQAKLVQQAVKEEVRQREREKRKKRAEDMLYETKCPCRARNHMHWNNKCDETDCNECCPLAIIAAEEKADHEAD